MLYFVFIAFAVFGFYSYARTLNLYYLFSGMFTLIYSGFLAFVPHIGVFGEQKLIAFTSLFISVAFGIAGMSQVILGNNRWRGRDLFELIASNIEESTQNGFTSRPHPVARTEYNRDEIMAFVKYMQSKLLGLTVIDDKKIYLVPVKNGHEYSMLLKSGYSLLEGSWISFHVDGQISVHICKADYLDYREPLSFNQLCQSMGDQFIEFLELFEKGEEVRIIDKLNQAKTGIFN